MSFFSRIYYRSKCAGRAKCCELLLIKYAPGVLFRDEYREEEGKPVGHENTKGNCRGARDARIEAAAGSRLRVTIPPACLAGLRALRYRMPRKSAEVVRNNSLRRTRAARRRHGRASRLYSRS